jgi:hypothetical protein
VLFCLLLDITDLLCKLLQCVFISSILQLEVCFSSQKLLFTSMSSWWVSYPVAFWLLLIATPCS